MAKTYDDSFHPPPWWILMMDKRLGIDEARTDGWLARAAAAVDARDQRWGADRISKLRKGSATIQLVIACSAVLGIPSPVVLARDENDAIEIDAWLAPRRRRVEKLNGTGAKRDRIVKALDASVEAAKDQTDAVESKNEGSPRGLGHRRASGSRGKVARARS